MLRRHVLRALACIFAVCGALLASPAAAQDRLFLGGVEIGAHGRLGQTLGSAPVFADGEVAGGRYVVSSGYHFATDARTGRQMPLPGHRVLAVDPARPFVFIGVATNGLLSTEVVQHNLASGETRVVATADPGATFLSARFAVDAERLFVASQNSVLGTFAVIEVDTRGGAGGPRTVSLSDRGPTYAEWAVTPDGRRLFRVEANHGVAAYDVATGLEAKRLAVPDAALRWFDAIDGLVLQQRVDPVNILTVVDRDLALQTQAHVPRRGGCFHPSLAISPHTLRVYLLSGYGGRFADPLLSVLDWTTGVLAGEARQVPAAANCDALALLTAPGAPRRVAAIVTGRDVALSWQNVGGASGFVLDIGFSPGRTVAQVYLGPQSYASFANVPAGTYYLRLRGGNEFGGGRPSQEIRVVVP